MGCPASACELEGSDDLNVLLHLFLDGDFVTDVHLERRNVDLLAVYMDMAVAHELPCLIVGGCKSESHHNVIEAALELGEQVFAGDALLACGLLEVRAELVFQDAVHPFDLLLFPELQAISYDLGLALPSMLPGLEIALLNGARRLKTPFPLEEQLHTFSPAKPAYRSYVSSQFSLLENCLYASSLRRPASVVRNRRRISYRADLEAGSLESADSGVAPGAGTLHVHFQRAHSHFACAGCSRRGRLLRGKWRSLARALESQGACAGPAHDISFKIGNCNDGVIEGSENVGRARGYDPFFFLLCALLLRLSHSSNSLGFCRGLAFDGDRASSGTFARARIRVRALSAHGQAAAMTQATVRTDFHEPLDIEGSILSKISLDAMLLFDQLADLVDLVIVELTNLGVKVDRRFRQNP